MALSFDLRRAVRQVLSYYEPERIGNPRELLVYLMDLLDYGDFRIVEQAASFGTGEHTNLIGLRGPQMAGGGLLLCSSVGDWGRTPPSLWTETEEDPYNPTERDGLLFAAGAVSGKIDLVCKILAASSVEPESLRRPLIVAGLFGTDARVGGAMYLLDSGLCAPEWALIGEPTDLALVAAHRGYLVLRFDLEIGTAGAQTSTSGVHRTFKVDVLGSAAHSAMPSLGRNAVGRAFEIVSQLQAGPVPFTTHRIAGGGTPENIPDRCSLYLRTTDPGWLPCGRDLVVEEVGDPPELGPPLDDAINTWTSIRAQLHELFRWSAPDTAPDFVPSSPIHSVMEADTASDRLQVWLEYRTLPGQRTEDLIRDVDALTRRSPGVPASVSVERNLLPFDGDPDSRLARRCKRALRDLSLPAVVGTYPGTAEAWIFGAAGIDTLLFGPGNALATRFRPNEHVLMRQVECAAAFYERLIRRLCC